MDTQHRVVIVGGGFGGLFAARTLKRTPVQVTLIDRRNFHLFQPLLYQVATGGLFVDIRVPARQKAPVRFTFFWTTVEHWEGRDFQVGADMGGREGSSSTRRKKQSHNDAGIVAAASDV